MWLSRTHSLKTECGNNAMWEYLKLANDEVARPGNKCRQCLLIYFSLVAVSWGLCDWFAREVASWWVWHSSWKLSSHVWMWELDYKESWAPKNWCFWTVVLEKTLESPLDCKEIQPVHPKGDQSWVFIGRTDAKAETLATWCEELTHLKRPWYWERLKAGGEGDDRGWDGWMASQTQWTWAWVGSGSWWWTGRPGILQFTGLQRVGHDWATELNWTWKLREDERRGKGRLLTGRQSELIQQRQPEVHIKSQSKNESGC